MNPGSQAALDAGCICPVVDNHHGRGWNGKAGYFVYNGDCRVHKAETLCPACGGAGGVDVQGHWDTCYKCSGSGKKT